MNTQRQARQQNASTRAEVQDSNDAAQAPAAESFDGLDFDREKGPDPDALGFERISNDPFEGGDRLMRAPSGRLYLWPEMEGTIREITFEQAVEWLLVTWIPSPFRETITDALTVKRVRNYRGLV
ncbi:MAG TPA: hypothetical protein P5534_15555 [Candidatus Paceibacterota bacterium]|nr:hypothetical protein [Candidatus Paceibacterota bacterium]HRZ57340.1 hypothetical protein [Candidatus Paceibacterota bacterium]